MGLIATIGAAALLAFQLAIAPPWQSTAPPPDTFPALHGPSPSELFAALTGQEHQAMAEELKAIRALMEAGPDTEAALPTVRARLAKLQADEEHKLQQDTTPALALAAVVGRIDGAIGAIQHAASRVNANPPPATVAPLSLGVAGLGLLASLLGLLGGALGRQRIANDASDGSASVLRALLEQGWAELSRQREAGEKAASDQAVLGARLTGAVLDAESRLAARIAEAGDTLARPAPESSGEDGAVRRLEHLAEQLGDAAIALPSVASMLAETAETLRVEAPRTSHQAGLDALCQRLAEASAQAAADREAALAAVGEAIEAMRASTSALDATTAVNASLDALPAHVLANVDGWREEIASSGARAAEATRAAVVEAVEQALRPLPEALTRLEAAAAGGGEQEHGAEAGSFWLDRIEDRLDQTAGAVLASTIAEAASIRAALAEQAETLRAAIEAARDSAVAHFDHAMETGLATAAARSETHREASPPRGDDHKLDAAATRLIAAGESQAERLESMLRDIVSVAGSLPPVGNGLAETAASLGLAAREQGEIVAEACRRLDEGLRSLETLAGRGAASLQAVANANAAAMDAAGAMSVAATEALPATPDETVMQELTTAEMLSARLAEAAASLRENPAELPVGWAHATPALLTRIDVAVQRLRYAATALALAGDDVLAREAA